MISNTDTGLINSKQVSSDNFGSRRCRSSSYDHENERHNQIYLEHRKSMPRKSLSGLEDKSSSPYHLPPIDNHLDIKMSSISDVHDSHVSQVSSLSNKRVESIRRVRTLGSVFEKTPSHGTDRRSSQTKSRDLKSAMQFIEISDEKRKQWSKIAITILSAFKFQKLLFLDSEIKEVMKRRKDRVRFNAMITICIFFRRIFLKSNIRFRKRAIILLKHGWRIRLFYRCVRRKMAVAVLRNFFYEYSYFSIPYLMYRYRSDACRLQNYFRSFLAITEARVLALNLIWIRVERDYSRNELPALLMRDRELKRQHRLSISQQDAWKDTKIDGVHFPHLTTMTNRVTLLASSLSETLEKGQEARDNFKSAFPSTHNVDKPMKHTAPQKLANRMKAIRDFLTSIRLAFKISRQSAFHYEPADKLTLDEAKQILRGESCPVNLARVKQIKRKAMSVLMLYTGDNAETFMNLVQEEVRLNNGIGQRKSLFTPRSRAGSSTTFHNNVAFES